MSGAGEPTGMTDGRYAGARQGAGAGSRPGSRSGTASRARPRSPSRYDFSTATVRFTSEGDRCEADLYRPARPRDAPVVVLAGPFGGERTFGPPTVAERLAERGVAALAFDYRRHGGSEGEPRGLVAPDRDRVDWLAAIRALRELSGVDGSRVALWGGGYSGGVALAAAAATAEEPRVQRRIRAVVGRVPWVDGRAVARTRSPGALARAAIAGVRDRVGGLAGRPHEVPVSSDSEDEFAVCSPTEAAGYRALVPADATWTNAVRARSLLAVPRFRPVGDLDRIRCPVCLVGAVDDGVVPVGSVAAAADRLDDAESTLVRLPGDHFDALGGRTAPQALGHELTFLEAALF